MVAGMEIRVRRIRVMAVTHDLVCAALALPIAYLVRTGDLPQLTDVNLFMMAILTVSAGLCFYGVGVNRGSWRYASIQEFLRIAQAAILATLISVLATFAFSRLDAVPRLVPLIACVVMIMLVTATRVAYRILKERHIQQLFRNDRGGEPVLLVGYGDDSIAFVRHMATLRSPAYHVVGVIAQTERHLGRRIENKRILGTIDDMADIIKRFRANDVAVAKVLVSSTKTDPEGLEKILDIAGELSLPVFILPNHAELGVQEPHAALKPVAIKLDDLLDRPVAEVDLKPVATLLRDKVIVITGGGGSIGSGLVEQTLSYSPRTLVIIDSSEHNLYIIDQLMREKYPYQDIKAVLADIRDAQAIKAILLQYRPNIVFHAAALKHVPMVEHNPIEGANTNILGTVNVADAAVAARASVFIMISTDKAVNPTNVMGASKRFAEAYCQTLDRAPNGVTRFITVRFGNVLGSSGSVVPLFARQIANGGPITVTHPEMKRYFMSINEAVRLVLAASAKGVGNSDDRGKIMVLHMGIQVRIVEIAMRMIRLAGLKPNEDIQIRFTGLRPGEKLFEERLATSELIEPTGDAWLQVAISRQNDAAAVMAAVAGVREAVELRNPVALIKAIRLLVPELLHGQPSTLEAIPDVAASTTVGFAEARSRLRT
jgi:FlaA1/EpsC-like NDP-sugar epimerase